MKKVKTLKSSITVHGTGLMSAVPVELELCPSDKKEINFHIGDYAIRADVDNVLSTEHCVVLGNPKNPMEPKVALVEHFMASLAIMGIDGLEIYFKNPNFEIAKMMQNAFEMPIFDGSAKVWIEKYNEAGLSGENEDFETINEPITLQKGKSHIVILPSDEKTKITYSVNYNHPDYKNRFATLNLDENLDEIIEGRTFGYLKDLEKLQAAGYSRGVTIDNTVGLTEDGYTTTLRSECEPIKHKILDIIGDLYLTGYNPLKLNANIIVKEAGHALHVQIAKKLKTVLGEKNDTRIGIS